MKDKQKNVPQLRFQDENGDAFPDWRKLFIYDLCEHQGGTALEKYVTDGGAFKFISIGNYSKDGKYIDNGQRIDLVDKAKTKILAKNDLVMILNDKTAEGDLIGATILIEEDNKYIYNQRSEKIVCNSNMLPIFMWYLLNSQKIRKRIFSLSQGKTQIYINFSSVYNIMTEVPTLPEQTRIADFFSKIDAYIEYQEKVIEKLEEEKRGLMQRIFSQEVRFRDENGEVFSDWEEKRLGEVGKCISGVGFSEKYQGTNNKEIQVYKVSDMNLNENRKYMIRSNNSIDEDTCKQMKSKPINRQSLIFAKVGAAIFLERKRITTKKFIMDNNMMAVIPQMNITIEFLYYYCNNIRFAKYAQVGALPSYNNSDIGSIKMSVPPLPEQTRIADFFSKIDELLEKEKCILENWKLLKKGLLQQMFV